MSLNQEASRASPQNPKKPARRIGTLLTSVPMTSQTDSSLNDDAENTQTPRRWRADGWTAQVLKNEDDDGWAVAMTRDGAAEPALVGPWTMGRDKKNPKPLDAPAFHTLVKTAHEFVRRSEQQLHASLHQSIDISTDDGRVCIRLDIVPDEDEPYALLSARDEAGDLLAEWRVLASFKLNRASAEAWASQQFKKPA
jgi:hypothetical protein